MMKYHGIEAWKRIGTHRIRCNRGRTDKSKRFVTAIVGYEQEKCVVMEKSRLVFEKRVFFRGRVKLTFKQRGERRDWDKI